MRSNDEVCQRIEHAIQLMRGDEFNIGEIAVACALGYLDLRFAGAWRADHPRLVGWLEAFSAAVPAYAATAFSG